MIQVISSTECLTSVLIQRIILIATCSAGLESSAFKTTVEWSLVLLLNKHVDIIIK